MNASIYFFLSHEGIFNGQKVYKLQIISNDTHKDKYRILVQMIKSLLVRAGQLSTKAFWSKQMPKIKTSFRYFIGLVKSLDCGRGMLHDCENLYLSIQNFKELSS